MVTSGTVDRQSRASAMPTNRCEWSGSFAREEAARLDASGRTQRLITYSRTAGPGGFAPLSLGVTWRRAALVEGGDADIHAISAPRRCWQTPTHGPRVHLPILLTICAVQICRAPSRRTSRIRSVGLNARRSPSLPALSIGSVSACRAQPGLGDWLCGQAKLREALVVARAVEYADDEGHQPRRAAATTLVASGWLS